MLKARAALVTYLSDSEIAYLFRDAFLDAAAAGSVNNTPATPGPGNRVIVDSANHLSVSGGNMVVDGGEAGGDPNYYTGSYARTVGRTVLAEVMKTCTDGTAGQLAGMGVGWDSDQTSAFQSALYADGYTLKDLLGSAIVGDIALNKRIAMASILRPSSGGLMFIKGGHYRYWTMIGNSGKVAGDPMYAGIYNIGAKFTVNDIKVLPDLLLVSALASDSFDAADGTVVATTNGLGFPEGLGGSGVTWEKVGTWVVSSNQARCSVLGAGSIGMALTDVGKADVIVYVATAQTSGSAGVIVRYVDANNYIRVVYDKTNFTVIEKVAGADNTIIASAAATYGAARIIEVMVDGPEILVRYNQGQVGIRGLINSALLTGTKHGLYVDNIANWFNNYYVLARGTGGEYESLLGKYTNYHDVAQVGWQLSAYNPYATARDNTYRGFMHNHSNASDGDDPPATLAAGYAGQAYVWAGLTDHDVATADPEQAGLTWLTGVEETTYTGHVLALGITAQTALTEEQAVIDFHYNNGSFVSLAHPTGDGSGGAFPQANAKLCNHYDALEVYNSKYAVVGDFKNGYSYVDDILSQGDKRVFLTVGEDTHSISDPLAYTTAVMVHADTNTAANILASLKAGNYYCRYTPIGQADIVLTVALADGVITVTTDDTSTITFIGRYGTTLKTESGTSSEYTVAAGDKYVRVLVTRGTAKAWSNPIWF